MVGHGGSSAGSYLADPTSPIPSHCASIVVTSTLRVNPHSSEYTAHENEHSQLVEHSTILVIPHDTSNSIYYDAFYTRLREQVFSICLRCCFVGITRHS